MARPCLTTFLAAFPRCRARRQRAPYRVARWLRPPRHRAAPAISAISGKGHLASGTSHTRARRVASSGVSSTLISRRRLGLAPPGLEVATSPAAERRPLTTWCGPRSGTTCPSPKRHLLGMRTGGSNRGCARLVAKPVLCVSSLFPTASIAASAKTRPLSPSVLRPLCEWPRASRSKFHEECWLQTARSSIAARPECRV